MKFVRILMSLFVMFTYTNTCLPAESTTTDTTSSHSSLWHRGTKTPTRSALTSIAMMYLVAPALIVSSFAWNIGAFACGIGAVAAADKKHIPLSCLATSGSVACVGMSLACRMAAGLTALVGIAAGCKCIYVLATQSSDSSKAQR